MTRLDDELAKAVAEAEARDQEAAHDAGAVEATDATAASDGTAMSVPTGNPVPGRSGPAQQRHLGLLIGVVVVATALVAMAMTLDPIYSRSVGKLLDDRESLADRNVRVTGMLVKGSLAKRDDPCEYRFLIHDGERELAVRFPQCVVPDTFRDMPGMDVEVTAEGKLGQSHFQATNIMAKCPSKYEMQERAEKGEKAPHTAAVPDAIPDFATVSTDPPASAQP